MRARFILLPFLLLAAPVHAQDAADDFTLKLKGDKFSPDPLTVPAGQKVKLTVKNETAATAEFESADFSREKVVQPGSQIVVNIGPLDAGKYTYVNDFHRETSGTIIAK